MEKRKLQDIKPVARMDSITGKERASSPVRRSAPINLPREIPYTPSSPKGSSKNVLWVLAVVCIFALFFSLSFLFEKAYVNVIPKSLPVAFDQTDTFSAKKDSLSKSDLSYIEMSISGDASANVPAKDMKSVYAYATGTVTLYNAYSPKPYLFLKDTQIKGANGQLYKMNQTTNIPGYKKMGMSIVPGSIDVGVTAVFPGEASNVERTGFTVPVLAKTSQAKLIYASSKTPISGGASGNQYSVLPEDLNKAFKDTQDKLKNSLMGKARVQIPDGYLFFDGATVFTTDDIPNIPYSKDQNVSFGVHGKLTAYLIKKDPLVNAIVTKVISDYNDEPVSIPKISSLSDVPLSATLDPENDTTFSFSLSGEAKIVWQVKPEDIQNALSDSKKTNFESNLTQITGVGSASFITSPFWVQSFPKDLQKIFVSIKTVE